MAGKRARVTADLRPLQTAPFRRLWASTTVTAVASQLTAVAVPVQVYDLTGSSAYVGYASLAGLVPMVAAALWGGAVADAVDRRRMLLVTSSGIALTSALLWAQAAAGLESVAVLLVLIAVQQALFGANSAVSGAVTPRLITADLLPAANALQSSVMWFGGIAGPLLAGALIPLTGLGTLYLVDAIALCLTVWAVWRLPPLPPAPSQDGVPGTPGGASVVRRIGAGLVHLTRHRILLAAYLADFIALFLGMPAALFPQIAHETFGDPPGGGFAIGVLYAAMSVGALAVGLCSGLLTRTRRHGAMVVAAVCAWGLAIAAFGLAERLWTAAFFLALSGSALMVLGMFRKTILQTAAVDGMRGRLQGVDTVVAAGGPRLAGLVHGTAGAAVGATWAVTGGGILVVVTMLAVALTFPSFRRYRGPEASEDAATAIAPASDSPARVPPRADAD
ncbi:MFS transporter [Streptomyces sp. MTZ3.1]|uniref:MFS transporter n=2 Tax=Streptomyces meridianus TaxID=2938945 RepID=A0ABT0X108_9ACTN|nr:MFS transporter [Streptomyces meridianus]MCM2576249.1 MFS transporter [Streptomyces meridianus]